MLKATDDASYRKLLNETIIHETIHAYIAIDGRPIGDFTFKDAPNLANDVDNGWGSLADWMEDRYPKSHQGLKDYRARNKNRYLDIDGGAQAFIDSILNAL